MSILYSHKILLGHRLKQLCIKSSQRGKRLFDVFFRASVLSFTLSRSRQLVFGTFALLTGLIVLSLDGESKTGRKY